MSNGAKATIHTIVMEEPLLAWRATAEIPRNQRRQGANEAGARKPKTAGKHAEKDCRDPDNKAYDKDKSFHSVIHF